jgi:hypothetical protein
VTRISTDDLEQMLAAALPASRDAVVMIDETGAVIPT